VRLLALDDPDAAGVRAAAEGLQHLSRALGPAEVSQQPTAAERHSLVEKWKAWYTSLRPDAQFRN